MLNFYQWATSNSGIFLQHILKKRAGKGKEDPKRLKERTGVATRTRPEGPLMWLHAASVGEAQSALILIETLLERHNDLHILVTTGTVTSAQLATQKLPDRAFHQFYPLDHPQWVKSFLNQWNPDFILWMESELWPNMLTEIKKRSIPGVLLNARLSPRSYARWKFFRSTAQELLKTFEVIMTQTDLDKRRYDSLGARNAVVTDNLKYSATPLAVDQTSFETLSESTKARPKWVYASTHKGEEDLACRVHKSLKNEFPGLLTIIVPRHPERREDIVRVCEDHALSFSLRGEDTTIPAENTDIYIADTLGELGLFYKLCPVALIGRSFSDDGGGGHNPIEAALLNCAVLHGPHVQNLQEIYDEMDAAGAARCLNDQRAIVETLSLLLKDPERTYAAQSQALAFAQQKSSVINRVLDILHPLITRTGLTGSFEHKGQAGIK